MRAPSIKGLTATFPDLNTEQVRLLRKVLAMEIDPADDSAFAGTFPATRAWRRGCYHTPPAELIALNAADELLGTFGIEGWTDPDDMHYGVSYCNTGDSYAATVCLITDDHGTRWYLGCWANLAERGVCGGDK